MVTTDGDTFYQHCRDGRMKEVKQALEQNKGNASQLKALLEHEGENKTRPLHVAIDLGHEAVAMALLAANADPSAKDADGVTPLHMAVWEGQEAVVKALLAAGADPAAAAEQEDRDGSHTPLHWAATAGQVAMVPLLLESGANLEALNNEEETPLHFAAWNGQEAMARKLVEVGANCKAVNKTGDTPLNNAAYTDENTPKDKRTWLQLEEDGVTVEKKKCSCWLTIVLAQLNNLCKAANDNPEIEVYSVVYRAYDVDKFASLTKYVSETLSDEGDADEEVGRLKSVLRLFLVLIDSKRTSTFKFTDAEFSKLSKGFSDSLKASILQSEFISEPLAILALLAGALGNRARRRAQVRDDLLALRSKVVQLALAVLSVPEMDQENAALEALGYSVEHISSGDFVKMAKFSSSSDALDAPFHFLVAQGVAEIIAVPQLQSTLDKVFGRSRHTFVSILGEDNTLADLVKGFCDNYNWTIQDWRTLPKCYLLSQAILHCLYLGATILVICYSGQLSWSSVVLTWMTVGYFLEEIIQFFSSDVRNRASRYIEDPWNLMDVAFLLFFSLWCITGEDNWLAVNLFVIPFRLLRYFSIFKTSGILVAVLFRMIIATVNFLVFYATILVGFSGMLTVFYNSKDEFESLPISCLTLFDASLGNYDFTIFMDADNEGYNWSGIALLVGFLLLSTVMILNLLIAVLSDEYSQLSEHSYQEWCLMYAEIVQENTTPASKFPDNIRLPPPLSLLSYIGHFLLWISELVGQQRCASNDGATLTSEGIVSPLNDVVAQPDIQTTEPDSSPAAETVDTTIITKLIVIFMISIVDVTVHLVVGLPWALISLYISSFRAIHWIMLFGINVKDKDTVWGRWGKWGKFLFPSLWVGWILIGVPLVAILSFVLLTPAVSFNLRVKSCWEEGKRAGGGRSSSSSSSEEEEERGGRSSSSSEEEEERQPPQCIKTDSEEEDKCHQPKEWLNSMRNAIASCAITEDGNEASQVLGEVAKLEAKLETQVGELKAMMTRLLEAQGLKPLAEEEAAQEEGGAEEKKNS